jgi:hypothetical protein
MANPFDQFDSAPATGGNPFDAFDAQAKPARQTGIADIYNRRVREGREGVSEGMKQGGFAGYGKAALGALDYLGAPASAAFAWSRPLPR